MTQTGGIIAAVLGLVTVVGVGYAVAGTNTAPTPVGPAPPSTPTLVSQQWTLTQGHRYMVTLWLNGAGLGNALLTNSLTIPQVTAVFPNSTASPISSPMPSGSTLNVIAVTAGAASCSYTFDLIMQSGTMTAGELASPMTGTDTSLTMPNGTQTLSVTVQDLGPTPAYGGGAATSSWTLTTPSSTIMPLDDVALSVSAADWGTMAASMNLPVTAAGWDLFLHTPGVTNILKTSNLQTYGPGDTLPVDWPPGDPSPATEYHARFTYNASVPLSVGASPLSSAMLWTRPPLSTTVGLAHGTATTIPPVGLQATGVHP